MAKSDPTKDAEFQKVVRHFLTTPHKPHAPLGKRKAKRAKSPGGRKRKSQTKKPSR
jgi:hypothetical protein